MTQLGMPWSRWESRIVLSAGVHDPQRCCWLSTQRTVAGPGQPLEVALRQRLGARARGRRPRACARARTSRAGRPSWRTHSRSSALRHPGRDEHHDRAVVVAVGRDGTPTATAASYLDGGRLRWLLHGGTLLGGPPPRRRSRASRRRRAPRRAVVERPGRDDALPGHPQRVRPRRAVVEEVELARARARRCRSRTGSRCSSASADQLVRRVLALRPAVDLHRDLVLARTPRRPPRASNSLCGRVPRPPGPAGRCSGRARWCGGCARRRPSAGSSGRCPSAAWSAPRPRRRRAGRASPRTGRARRRRGCRPRCPLSSRNPPSRWRVDGVDHVELPGQPGGAEPVGDLQPGRVVGERHVLVADLHGGHHHLLDRRAAVGPVRVRVQVAAQPRAELLAAGDQRPGAPAPGPRGTPGPRPASASRMTASVALPMPSSSRSVPAAARSASSAGGVARTRAAAPRNALTLKVSASVRSSRNAIRRSAAGRVGAGREVLLHVLDFLLSTAGGKTLRRSARRVGGRPGVSCTGCARLSPGRPQACSARSTHYPQGYPQRCRVISVHR